MKHLVALLLFLCSTGAYAFSFQDFNGRCGDVKLFVGPVERNKLAVTDADDTGGYIVLDPLLIQTVSPQALTFIYFHECGHRVNGDSSLGYRSYNAEQKADCYAAKRFSGEYGEQTLNSVLSELVLINGTRRSINIWNCRK